MQVCWMRSNFYAPVDFEGIQSIPGTPGASSEYLPHIYEKLNLQQQKKIQNVALKSKKATYLLNACGNEEITGP